MMVGARGFEPPTPASRMQIYQAITWCTGRVVSGTQVCDAGLMFVARVSCVSPVGRAGGLCVGLMGKRAGAATFGSTVPGASLSSSYRAGSCRTNGQIPRYRGDKEDRAMGCAGCSRIWRSTGHEPFPGAVLQQRRFRVHRPAFQLTVGADPLTRRPRSACPRASAAAICAPMQQR